MSLHNPDTRHKTRTCLNDQHQVVVIVQNLSLLLEQNLQEAWWQCNDDDNDDDDDDYDDDDGDDDDNDDDDYCGWTSKALRFPALLAIASPNLDSASATFPDNHNHHKYHDHDHADICHYDNRDHHLNGLPCGRTGLALPVSIDTNLHHRPTASAANQ